ncbi:MAG: sugar phosphate isomerase/epimerase [Verrucomicrobiae bacterium]|nr:sugar phosphate isomerase/epimerase [Verrucomicrobiae bacterium]
MNSSSLTTDRRQFLKTMTVAGAGLALGAPGLVSTAAAATSHKLKLGLDNFAVRAMNWKAHALLDYSASLKLDALFITDLDAFENHEPVYLREVKAKADDLGISLYLGTWSICPTSKSFRNKWGTAEEHLALGIRMAKALGSPVIRVVLGAGEDRRTEGGIEARIADTVKVCQACRSQAVDAGVKIAVENHAGDMQAWELVTLIEAAGKDYVGANMDSGNACWALEDPMQNLLTLAPFVLTTSLRDSMVWESENGAKVQWTAMGEGCVDMKAYFAKFAELCPHAPVIIETISGFAREFPYLKSEFWQAWPKARASEFAQFLALAKRGKAIPSHRSANAQEEQEYQKGEFERSITYCKEVLGLGAR